MVSNSSKHTLQCTALAGHFLLFPLQEDSRKDLLKRTSGSVFVNSCAPFVSDETHRR
ncbi:hypothetical protein GYMLUDRAFT_78401 [Collybiopsis luxurians FD-317 M1]|uniref:Uncharacterized protein n=1 Tax=Collybiopsis luxurians FD-317 M1 TaxID=944289 RepID=A0A0D0C7X1_9AGAR|nr:hypothetical protein GYMLUDRAFT_51490 [Collybiopsis luxurians FD-317 M1]KIK50883.1 hypothetical protein GYMLUDRAFT_78401 [Collybiopsis luxurians FD-317 M1]